MEKLTLKEIGGYLPYGLEFIYNNDSSVEKNKWLLVSLGKRENGNDFFAKAESSDYKNQINTTISLIKPILYPLEMLTKTIVHNGVEIIPIVELYKLSNEHNYKSELDYEFVLSWGGSEILKVFHNREKDEYTEFILGDSEFRKDTRYSKGSDVYGIELPHPIRVNQKIYNQFKIKELLLEWHFDIHNLIERGLAIDKSKI